MIESNLSIENQKSTAQSFGITSLVLLGIILVLVGIIIFTQTILTEAILGALIVTSVLLAIILFGTTWRFLFNGLTFVSMFLSKGASKKFQIFVAVVTPLLMSLYFIITALLIKDETSISFGVVVMPLLNFWFLAVIAFITFSSWAFADQLDLDQPFRGFFIASTIFFVILLMGYNGALPTPTDEYGDIDDSYYEEVTINANRALRYFGQYLIYVAASYSGMLAKYLRMKKKRLIWLKRYNLK